MAVRPSASADRVAGLLLFLGAHGDQEFTLSELARRLKIDKTTCQATLLALLGRGLVVRSEEGKTYSLGPAAYALGHADGLLQRLVRVARAQLEVLSDEVGMETVATMTAGDHITVVARVLRSKLFSLSLRVGQTVPLVPPLGTVHVAWSSDETIDAWIRRAGPDVSAADILRYRRAVTAVRARGFSATLDEVVRQKLTETLNTIAEEPGSTHLAEERDRFLRELRHEEYQLLELAGSETYRINQISAPVFGPDATVVMAIGMMTPHEVAATEIPVLAGRLTAAAGIVSDAIGGCRPSAG